MATRFYLPNFNQPYQPPVSPTIDATWNQAFGGTGIQQLKIAKGGGTGAALYNMNAANPNNRPTGQFVSAPLAAQTISGTVKGMIAAFEVATTDNYNPAFSLRVVSRDGLTVRGTLLSVFGGGTELPITTASSLKFPAGWAGAGTALSSVTTVDGDRLVLEVGVNKTSTSVNNVSFELGSDPAKADYSETEGGTGGSPWIELSQDIVFGQDFMPAYSPPLPLQIVGNPWGYAFFTLPSPAVAVGGITTPQELDATTVLVTALLQKQTNKGVTATAVAATATLIKQVAKAITATSIAVTASLAAMKVILKVLTATTVLVTASLLKQVNKPLTATSVVVTASVKKQVNKLLTATVVVVTASLTAIRVFLKALTATTMVVSASLLKQINKPLVASSVAVTASVQKQVAKALRATNVVVTASLTAIRVFLKTLTATSVVVSASMVRQVKPVLSATVLATASVAKSITHRLTATVSALGSLVAQFLGTVVGPIAALLRMSEAQTSSVNVTEPNIVTASVEDVTVSSAVVTDSLGAGASVSESSRPNVSVDDVLP